MLSRVVTRGFFLLYVAIFIFGIWSCRHAQDLRQKPAYFHDNGFENAWIQYNENGLVQVHLVGEKVSIVFRPPLDQIDKFSIGYLAPVTFDCNKKSRVKCDLSKPFKLYASNLLVEVVEIKQY